MLALLVFVSLNAAQIPQRDIASQAFPIHRATTDVGDIMDQYPEYLEFVLAIGRSENPGVANQIAQRFAKLKRADEKLAARFLKGLRFEMIQKLELVGMPPKRVSTDSPVMRKWVAKYLSAWLREVDEYQFRAYASTVARNRD